MSVIGLLLICALIGLAAWALTKFIPMPAGIKTTIVVIAILVVILLALQAFGVLDELKGVDVPRV